MNDYRFLMSPWKKTVSKSDLLDLFKFINSDASYFVNGKRIKDSKIKNIIAHNIPATAIITISVNFCQKSLFKGESFDFDRDYNRTIIRLERKRHYINWTRKEA